MNLIIFSTIYKPDQHQQWSKQPRNHNSPWKHKIIENFITWDAGKKKIVSKEKGRLKHWEAAMHKDMKQNKQRVILLVRRNVPPTLWHTDDLATTFPTIWLS
jgi:hypothetical protein